MIKKYSIFINESTEYLNAASSETLEIKLEDLELQLKELQEEMSSIRSILDYRKTNKVEEYSNTLPNSIYDFDKEQLEFIFEHAHTINRRQYDIARIKYRELVGVSDTGFNQRTSQTFFYINTDYSFDNDNDDQVEGFLENEDQIKAIKFLGDNLKRVDNKVEFGVRKSFDDNNFKERVFYVSDSELYYYRGYGNMVKYNSISDVLEYLVKTDLDLRY